jgi:hypothetical protein
MFFNSAFKELMREKKTKPPLKRLLSDMVALIPIYTI